MRQDRFDTIVVGAGPIGAATSRHLAEQGADVLVVGPAEPAGFADHTGVWAGHYDQGRLAHVLEFPLVAGILGNRSRRRFAALQERTGIEFALPVESVTVMPGGPLRDQGGTWFDLDRLKANADDLNVEVHRLDEAELRRQYPDLRFEPAHAALVQRDALIVNPRALTRAELAAACAAGARLVRDEIVSVRDVGGGADVTSRSGATWSARSVVLATGAASNVTGLLPRPLAMDTFGATVVLVEVAGPDAVRLPALMYMKVRGSKALYGGIVMQPLLYPDGKWYVKCAGSSVLDTPLRSAEDIARWVRTGGRQDDLAEALALLTELVPGKEFGPARTRPCLVSANHSGAPYIDHVDENIVIAVEGERGAMAADEIGRLAARLVADGQWTDNIPGQIFRARWAD